MVQKVTTIIVIVNLRIIDIVTLEKLRNQYIKLLCNWKRIR